MVRTHFVPPSDSYELEQHSHNRNAWQCMHDECHIILKFNYLEATAHGFTPICGGKQFGRSNEIADWGTKAFSRSTILVFTSPR